MGKGRNRGFYYLAIAALACVFLGSSGMLLKNLAESARQKKAYEELAGRFETAEGSALGDSLRDGQAEGGENGEQTDRSARQEAWEGRVPVYEEMRRENPDFAGWIQIPGTRVDYPVVQFRDRPDYYLHRDFYGRESSFGTPYLAEDCSLEDPVWGLLIYGHHMKNGEMFAGLADYTEQEFWQDHREIRFDTPEGFRDYEVADEVKMLV